MQVDSSNYSFSFTEKLKNVGLNFQTWADAFVPFMFVGLARIH